MDGFREGHRLHGVARLLDWQLLHRAQGMRDVANFLASAVAPDVRRQNDEMFLTRYRDVLSECGVRDAPSAAELRISVSEHRTKICRRVADSLWAFGPGPETGGMTCWIS